MSMIDQQGEIKEREAKLLAARSFAVPDELLEIGELLRTQDNRATDKPMYIVEQLAEYPCDEERTCAFDGSRVIWYENDGDCREVSVVRAKRLEGIYRRAREKPDGYERCVMGQVWEHVTSCLTEQGCKDYIATNEHNLKSPRIYAIGSYRNFEFRAIRDWLMQLPSPSMLAASTEAINV